VPSDPRELAVWSRSIADGTAAAARAMIDAHAWSPAQRDILHTALAEFDPPAEPPLLSCRVFLCLLTAAGLGDGGLPPLELAALTVLLDIGFVLLDHVVDRDFAFDPALRAHWAGYGEPEIAWGAAALIALCPLLALELPVEEPARIAIARRLRRCMLSVSSAEQVELGRREGELPTLHELLAIVGDRTGERGAAYAAIGAAYAGASAEQVAACEAFGRALGAGTQICNDVHDLFLETPSRDLGSGTLTIPVALELERGSASEREELLARFRAARDDAAAEASLRALLRERGGLRRCAVVVGLHRARALSALTAAGLREPAHGLLADLAAGWLSFGGSDSPL
jgi:geranylgeranyl diphosphate synthase type I